MGGISRSHYSESFATFAVGNNRKTAMKLFHDTDTRQEIHMSHFSLWSIAVVFSWVLWTLIYFPAYREM